MRWGHRKAARELSKVFAKDRKDFTKEDVEEYKSNIKYIKKNKGSINVKTYEDGSFDFLDRNNNIISPQYANLLLKKANAARNIAALAATTAALVGAKFVIDYLS